MAIPVARCCKDHKTLLTSIIPVAKVPVRGMFDGLDLHVS